MQVDLSLLRKVAAVRGLVNSHLRARVWPLLLGIDTAQHAGGDYDTETHGDHADVKTINDDVARSLHSFTAGAAPALLVCNSYAPMLCMLRTLRNVISACIAMIWSCTLHRP
jgi:hypothetical protein